jgi:hypothetical protein
MNGRGRRQKGANGERELAAILSDQLGFEVKRKLGQARDGGHDLEIGRFYIEVKRQERLSIEDWCRQVELSVAMHSEIDSEGPTSSAVPVVIYRRSGQPWRCVVPLTWFCEAVREDLNAK